ncbi:MAG: hypothetical protein V1766_00495 [Pseudomonadota bacterium]
MKNNIDMKCRISALPLFVVLLLLLAIPLALLSYPKGEATYLLMSLRSSAPGEASLYYDLGGGFRDEDKAVTQIRKDPEALVYAFAIPNRNIFHFRFDPPATFKGEISIGNIRIVSARGKTLREIDKNHLKPLHQIQTFQHAGAEVSLTVQAGANDPQISIDLDSPFRPAWSILKDELFLGFIAGEILLLTLIYFMISYLWPRWRIHPKRKAVLAAFLFLYAGGLWIISAKATTAYLKVNMSSSSSGIAQLFYDTGSGYSEASSVRVNITDGTNFSDYYFRLPNQKILQFRLDPLSSAGRFVIRRMEVVSGLGILIRSLALYQVQPAYQIREYKLLDQNLRIVTEEHANDPQLIVSLQQPLDIGQIDLLLNPFFPVFALSLLLIIMLSMAGIAWGWRKAKAGWLFYSPSSGHKYRLYAVCAIISLVIVPGIHYQSFRILFTVLFFLFLLATCWLLAHRMGRRNLLLSGPLALAILIGFQAALLNILSLFSAVSIISLLCGNMIIILAVIYSEIRRVGAKGVLLEYGALVKCQADLWSGRSNPLALLVAPLMLILLLTALVYPPNTWDSMTYHMARVVYWIENGSVAYFPTAIERQNLMNPGAEYVILLLQLLSASDFLANLVQFISLYLLVSAMPSFLRLLGIRRRIANWGLVLAAALPMGVLQATSTQNDLAASCLGLALCTAALRLWHKNIRAKGSRSDIMVLALLGAVGYLVKATAILAALPFLLMAAMCYGIALIRRPQFWQRQAINLLLGVFLVAVVTGPDLYRKKEYTGSFTAARQEVFPFNGYWEQKVIHSVVGINFHVIPTEAFYKCIVKPLIGFFNCWPFPQPHEPFRNHEDFAGNPLHMIFAGVAILLFLFRFPRIPRPARWGVLFVCASWILLHATIRNQAWISRLQTPVFMLFPCFLAAWHPISKVRPVRFFFAAILIVITMSCLYYGMMTAVRNESRPLTLTYFLRLDRDSAYYANRPLKPQHDAVIETVKLMKIKRVGLVIGSDDYDYPLSWRLYRLGVEVRHVTSDPEWADAVYAPTDRPPAIKDWPVHGPVLINPRK